MTRKLVVNNLSPNGNYGAALFDTDIDEPQRSTSTKSQPYYISVNDVIRTVAVTSIASNHSTDNLNAEIRIKPLDSRDLLLIGCANSVLIYDSLSQNNVISVRTATPINAFSNDRVQVTNPSIVCGGPQKVYALRFDCWFQDGRSISAEVSSERSTRDTITCLTSGSFDGLELVLTGSTEQKLRAYQLDSFDHNIQACKLTIEEGGPISCICAVNTKQQQESTSEPPALPKTNLPPVATKLDPLTNTSSPDKVKASDEQMSHFAFGTENGTIGVHRLFFVAQTDSVVSPRGESKLSAERLWRQKCKQTPMTMLLYDINGDGLDELVVGFVSGRLEARSPFTGQLLATTRCFKSSDKLTSLTVIDYHNDGSLMLLACSTGGSMVGFKPRSSRPRVALQGYSLPDQQKKSRDQADGVFASLGQIPGCVATATSSSSMRTIDEDDSSGQASGDVSMKHGVDLHIESSQLNELVVEADLGNRPSKSDARQSHDLLLKVNALLVEQMELEKKACHAYYTNVYQASKFRSTADVSIGHRWDFDVIEVSLS